MERFTVSASTNGCFPQRKQTAFNSSIPISLPYQPRPLPPSPAGSFLLPPENPSPIASINPPGLGVFKAERYFSGDEDGCYQYGSSRSTAISEKCDFSYPLDTSVTSFDGSYGHYYRQESSRTAPTPSSEASWNSRSELLPHSSDPASSKAWGWGPRKQPSASAARRWWFWLSCLCTGKGSIIAEEKYKEQKTSVRSNHYLGSADGSGRDAGVLKRQGNGGLASAFPAIPEATLIVEEAPPAIMQLVGTKWPAKEEMQKEIYPSRALYSSNNRYPEGLGSRIVSSAAVPLRDAGGASGFSFPILPVPAPEDPHRESLDVFCPKEDAKPMAAATIAEFPRRSFAFQTSGPSPPRLEDDVASDSSSDLFEIESFSTQTGAPCHRRGSLDVAIGMVVAARRLSASRAKEAEWEEDEEETERASTAAASDWCYPPSEVSVQWSVTTAEGFDQASVATYSSATSTCGDPLFAFRAEQEKAACEGSGRSKGSGERRKRLSGRVLSRRPKKVVGIEPQSTRHVSEKSRDPNAANTPWNAARFGNWAGGKGGIASNDHQFVSRPLQEPRLARRNSPWITRPIESR